jgi:hypothetical protein
LARGISDSYLVGGSHLPGLHVGDGRDSPINPLLLFVHVLSG